jgi:hypothetical protein
MAHLLLRESSLPLTVRPMMGMVTLAPDGRCLESHHEAPRHRSTPLEGGSVREEEAMPVVGTRATSDEKAIGIDHGEILRSMLIEDNLLYPVAGHVSHPREIIEIVAISRFETRN